MRNFGFSLPAGTTGTEQSAASSVSEDYMAADAGAPRRDILDAPDWPDEREEAAAEKRAADLRRRVKVILVLALAPWGMITVGVIWAFSGVFEW